MTSQITEPTRTICGIANRNSYSLGGSLSDDVGRVRISLLLADDASETLEAVRDRNAHELWWKTTATAHIIQFRVFCLRGYFSFSQWSQRR
jgi:hypothetical protein